MSTTPPPTTAVPNSPPKSLAQQAKLPVIVAAVVLTALLLLIARFYFLFRERDVTDDPRHNGGYSRNMILISKVPLYLDENDELRPQLKYLATTSVTSLDPGLRLRVIRIMWRPFIADVPYDIPEAILLNGPNPGHTVYLDDISQRITTHYRTLDPKIFAIEPPTANTH